MDAKHEAEAASRAKEATAAVKTRRERLTFQRVARTFHESIIEPNRTPKHAAQWIATLETHVFPKLGAKPIDTVTGVELRDLLLQLQADIPETASRIRQRVDAIFDHAVFEGLVETSPAGAPLRRKLREAAETRERGHFRALRYIDAPAFVVALRKEAGIAARGLEFLLLTAARTGEVLGATWAEMNGSTWIVPGERMKAKEEHRIYMPARAVDLLAAQRKRRLAHCFASSAAGAGPLSNMAFLELIKRMGRYAGKTTAHGLRSTFSTWAYEVAQRTAPHIARQDVIEACLVRTPRGSIFGRRQQI